MHDAAYAMMNRTLERYRTGPARHRPSVLDVGSADYNGTFRPLIEGRSWQYTGLDLEPGQNVDIVSRDPYCYPFLPRSFELVISGNTAHNVARPWLWVKELTRILKPGGLLVLVTVWQHGLNEYPQDYFRFMPDGLRVLFDDTGQLTDYAIESDAEGNIVGSAFKV